MFLKDSRTLQGTPKSVSVVDRSGGQYKYFGIEHGLKTLHQQSALLEDEDNLSLLVNVDGIPLFKSSKTQFWPVLCKTEYSKPFIVALYCGNSKPDPVDDFLEDFLTELSYLTQNGLKLGEQLYNIVIKAFVCDAPARSYLKCTKGHNSYFSCERCLIKGKWNGRVVFDGKEVVAKRTDDQFNNFQYPGHQTRLTPLVAHGIACISQFSLDYMHLVCLGAVRRILYFLTQGPPICKLSVRQRGQISENLAALSRALPREFARQPRPLTDLERWKATEFRSFLLYTGPIVLKDVLSEPLYFHFLELAVSVSILLETNEDRRCHFIQYAEELLKHFVGKCEELYGGTFNVFNIHNLVHLADDVSLFKCSLNDVSAFPFENHLQKIKKLVKKGQNPVVQVAKRLSELEQVGKATASNSGRSSYYYISENFKDGCFVLDDASYAFVQRKQGNELLCDVIREEYTHDFDQVPCSSKLLNTVFITKRNLQRYSKRTVFIERIERKAVCLPHDDGYAVFPMLHDFDRV